MIVLNLLCSLDPRENQHERESRLVAWGMNNTSSRQLDRKREECDKTRQFYELILLPWDYKFENDYVFYDKSKSILCYLSIFSFLFRFDTCIKDIRPIAPHDKNLKFVYFEDGFMIYMYCQ